jgi:hypothetical protein
MDIVSIKSTNYIGLSGFIRRSRALLLLKALYLSIKLKFQIAHADYMKILISLALLALLMMSISSASLSTEDKTAIEDKAEKLLSNFKYVQYVDVEITPQDDLHIFIIPIDVSVEENMKVFMGNLGAVTTVYVASCKNWPELQNLEYQKGYEKDEPSVEMYALRNWTDDVREDARGYNNEDLRTLGNKIYSTIREV